MKTALWKPRTSISLRKEGDEWLEDFWKSSPL